MIQKSAENRIRREMFIEILNINSTNADVITKFAETVLYKLNNKMRLAYMSTTF